MVHVREATPADGDAVLAVHREAVQSVDPEQYTDDQLAAWAAAQDDPDQYPFDDETQYLAVAETEDGEVVGFLGVDLETGVLETLYVGPDAQGDGVGRTLLERAEESVRSRDHGTLIVAASRNAVPFYERHGYAQKEETFPLDVDGTIVEFVRMEKPLE